MIDLRDACPTLTGMTGMTGRRRAASAALLLALMLGCNDDETDPMAPLVDPSGEYTVTLNQTTDECFDQLGTITWGGATLDLQGNVLMVDIPQAPGDPNCIHANVPYSMNTVQGTISRQLTLGSCNIIESLTLDLFFTDTGFIGTYQIDRTRDSPSGVCADPPLPCESSGTIEGAPPLGSPACP